MKAVRLLGHLFAYCSLHCWTYTACMCILFVNTIRSWDVNIYCTQRLTADQGLTHCMQLNFTAKISKVHECVPLCGIVPMVVILHEYVLVECQELKAKSTCTCLVPSYTARVTTEGLTHTWSSYHCEAHTWMSYQLNLIELPLWGSLTVMLRVWGSPMLECCDIQTMWLSAARRWVSLLVIIRMVRVPNLARLIDFIYTCMFRSCVLSGGAPTPAGTWMFIMWKISTHNWSVKLNIMGIWHL